MQDAKQFVGNKSRLYALVRLKIASVIISWRCDPDVVWHVWKQLSTRTRSLSLSTLGQGPFSSSAHTPPPLRIVAVSLSFSLVIVSPTTTNNSAWLSLVSPRPYKVLSPPPWDSSLAPSIVSARLLLLSYVLSLGRNKALSLRATAEM